MGKAWAGRDRSRTLTSIMAKTKLLDDQLGAAYELFFGLSLRANDAEAQLFRGGEAGIVG